MAIITDDIVARYRILIFLSAFSFDTTSNENTVQQLTLMTDRVSVLTAG